MRISPFFAGGLHIGQVRSALNPDHNEQCEALNLKMTAKVRELRAEGRSACAITPLERVELSEGSLLSETIQHFVVATDDDAEDLLALRSHPRKVSVGVISRNPKHNERGSWAAEEKIVTNQFRELIDAFETLVLKKAKVGQEE